MLNLFIGIIVNAMQEEHAKAEAEMMHDETAPIIRELQELKTEIATLREEMGGSKRRSWR